jgi:transposase-like protein
LEVILWAQHGYLQFPVNYRHRERMLVDRSVAVDNTIVYRWIQADALEFDKRLSPYLRPQ